MHAIIRAALCSHRLDFKRPRFYCIVCHFQGIFGVFVAVVVVVIVDDVFVLSIGVGLYFATKTCIRILNCDVDELRLNVFNRSNCFSLLCICAWFLYCKKLMPSSVTELRFLVYFFLLISAVLLFQLRECLYVRIVRARVLNNFNVKKCCSLFYVEFLLFALVFVVQ